MPKPQSAPRPAPYHHGDLRRPLIETALAMARAFTTATLIAAGCATGASAQTARWPAQKANAWYAQQSWLVGSNYVPASAINQLEMWQQATFDPAEIDREFGWAEAMGMNTMRVFLHDLLWQQDSVGFKKRIDRFLAIASRHHIRPRSCSSIPSGTPCLSWVRSIHRSQGFTTPAGCRALAPRRWRIPVNILG